MTGTPKFKSREFKATLGALKEIFDAHSLGITLMDALERRSAEQIYAKFARGERGSRMANKKKAELVGQITAGFFAAEDVAFQVIKELDRACQKERHIVASIPESQAPDRIGSYRAIALKRERAKFVWALARDDRASVRTLANRVIAEFFQEAADVETARAVVDGEASSPAQDVALAKRLREQAERLSEASEKLTDLETKVNDYENERARLLAQLGSKQSLLQQEEVAREDAERKLEEYEREAAEDVASRSDAEAAGAREQEARRLVVELETKVRRLTKLAGASERLDELQSAVEDTQKKNAELSREVERLMAASEVASREHVERQSKLQMDLDAAREELHRARQQIVDLERRVPSEAPTTDTEGILILLDQANLAATAATAFRRKVNFSALYDHLRAGRPVRRAIAFVVDNGGTAFDAFCNTLKRSGWELRIKKPKTFVDGNTKADWDMGMAMEAIDLRETVDTIVLVSGDGDFAPLVKQLHRFGKRVEVAAFPEALAIELVNAADKVTRLDHRTLES